MEIVGIIVIILNKVAWWVYKYNRCVANAAILSTKVLLLFKKASWLVVIKSRLEKISVKGLLFVLSDHIDYSLGRGS